MVIISPVFELTHLNHQKGTWLVNCHHLEYGVAFAIFSRENFNTTFLHTKFDIVLHSLRFDVGECCSDLSQLISIEKCAAKSVQIFSLQYWNSNMPSPEGTLISSEPSCIIANSLWFLVYFLHLYLHFGFTFKQTGATPQPISQVNFIR